MNGGRPIRGWLFRLARNTVIDLSGPAMNMRTRTTAIGQAGREAGPDEVTDPTPKGGGMPE